MTLREFAQLVWEMRYSQKRYFSTRSQDDLILSKRKEGYVDRVLSEILTTQQNLPLTNEKTSE